MMRRNVLAIACLLLLAGCARYQRVAWPLPFHATSDEVQGYACEHYQMCSGHVVLAQVGDDDDLTIVSDGRLGAKAKWCTFDSAGFKQYIRKQRGAPSQ